MKTVTFMINPEVERESFEILARAITLNTKGIVKLSKANKRVAFGVVCVSGAVYLTYKFAKKQAERINQLEQTVNTLVQIAVSEKPQEQQQTEE